MWLVRLVLSGWLLVLEVLPILMAVDDGHQVDLAAPQDGSVQPLQGGPHPLRKRVPLRGGLGSIQLVQQVLVKCEELLLLVLPARLLR
jgi:hypothetical protein